MKTYPIHPAADAFPKMGDEEFAALKADIQEHGQHDPVIIYEGEVLDGRHRYRACFDLGIDPSVIVVDDHSIGGDPFDYVWSCNFHRRHMTTSQRAMVGVSLKRAREADAERRQKAGATLAPGGAKGKSAEQAAKIIKVSPRTVERATKVAHEGATEVVDAVKEGKLTVGAAEKIVKKSATKEEQLSELKKATAPKEPKPKGEKPKKSGTETRKPADRKEALSLYGKLLRSLDKLAISKGVETELKAILAAIKAS